MRTLLLLSVLAVSPLSTARAARTTDAADTETLAAQATDVVYGRVVAAVAREVKYMVRTTYTVAPLHALRGDAAPLTFELPGGRLDGVTVASTGVPVWSVGDEVVVFAREGRPVSFDGLLTVRDGDIEDPVHRDATRVPLTLAGLTERVQRAALP